MKRAINSKRNKYKIHVRASFCKRKCHSHRQGWDPLLSFKDVVSLPSVEEGGTILEKKNNVFFPLEKTRNPKISTTGQEPSLLSKKTSSLHNKEGVSPLDGPFSRVDRKVADHLLQLGRSSGHFGRKSRDLDFAFPWHASMCSKFSGVRNKIPHISGEQTLQSLVEAFYCIALVLRKGGKVLVVNKNSEFSALFRANSLDAKSHLPNKNRFSQEDVKERNLPLHPFLQSKDTNLLSHFAEQNGLVDVGDVFSVGDVFYEIKNKDEIKKKEKLNKRGKETPSVELEDFIRKCAQYRSKSKPATAPFKWVGGCLTNWKEISKSVATLLYFSKRFGGFIKQNNIHFPRFKKMRASFQGFINVEKEELLLKAPPQLLFLFNVHESQQILHEATTLQIPVVALTDSSTDLSQITYPIPINSDSGRLVHRCLSQLMQITDRQGGFSK